MGEMAFTCVFETAKELGTVLAWPWGDVAAINIP